MTSSHDDIDELESLSNSSFEPHLNTSYSPSTSEPSQIKDPIVSTLGQLPLVSQEVFPQTTISLRATVDGIVPLESRMSHSFISQVGKGEGDSNDGMSHFPAGPIRRS
ncbi:hypothetical protein BKA70DRAFT_1449391 [Coprinopsis sp. MPI-PUGE-AT-0042]|nr:hypothetical protein BKA70DRAFT_1449391 [Coprinopsis sp. MPI-PUGE-AT-0042]